MNVQPYLIFPGTCRRALQFYSDVFGGAIEHLQTVGDSPLPNPPEHADLVFNSIFVAGELRLMASDGEPGKDPVVGQNFALFVECDDAESQRRLFSSLAVDGQMLFPLTDSFGMVEDSFYVRWMLAVRRP